MNNPKNNICKYNKISTILAFTAALIFGLIVCMSTYFSISPFQTIKILARGFSTEMISISVRLYDPTHKIITQTGPIVNSNRLSGSGNLFEIIKSNYPKQKIDISIYNNKPLIISKYSFSYQTLTDDALLHLHQKNELLPILTKEKNDFEQILILANWVNGLWKHGISGKFDPNNFDANTVIAQSEHGATFWCHVSAMTLIQVAASMGFEGRLVSLSRDGYVHEHAVTEFWSNYYQKWITIDPDFNVWYEKNGLPLNVLEIHNSQFDKQNTKINVMKGNHRPISELESRIPSLPEYYRYFEIDMRNDWLTNHYFPGHPSRSDKATIHWYDERVPKILNLKPNTSNPNDIYWDLNRTYSTFSAEKIPNKAITVNLQTVTPNFSYFEIKDNKQTILIKTNEYIWKLHLGLNSLNIRSVNTMGQKGIRSTIRIFISDI